MRESVRVNLILGARKIDVLAFGAVELDSGTARHVGGTHRQARLPPAANTGAAPELGGFVLLEHSRHAARGEDEAHVDQAIEHLSGALHEFVLLLVQDLIAGGLCVQDQVQRVIVVRHLQSPAQVEMD